MGISYFTKVCNFNFINFMLNYYYHLYNFWLQVLYFVKLLEFLDYSFIVKDEILQVVLNHEWQILVQLGLCWELVLLNFLSDYQNYHFIHYQFILIQIINKILLLILFTLLIHFRYLIQNHFIINFH